MGCCRVKPFGNHRCLFAKVHPRATVRDDLAMAGPPARTSWPFSEPPLERIQGARWGLIRQPHGMGAVSRRRALGGSLLATRFFEFPTSGLGERDGHDGEGNQGETGQQRD
jgi:hypothetical protein